MIGIMIGKFRLLVRKPGALIATTLICILFAFMVGKAGFDKVEIPVYSSMEADELKLYINQLNKGDVFHFKQSTEEDVKERVSEGKVEAGVHLEKSKYTIYVAGNTKNIPLLEQYVKSFYERNEKQKAMEGIARKSTDIDRNEVEWPEMFSLKTSYFANEEKPSYNQTLQSLFGFTLFFVIYTIGFNVVDILNEKQMGIWDRIIISPTSKVAVYTANLIYSFLIGYVQVVFIFLVFRFGAGVDFHGAFGKALLIIIPYLFSIVALTILLTGLVKTTGQFNALLPLVGVSFAMLGGAYWPLEIVSSKWLLAISKVIPVTYGMELLKGAVISKSSLQELLYPIGILLLMGVVMMGIGIRLIERIHV